MVNQTITRADIADAIHRQIGLARTESGDMVEAIIDELSLALKREGIVKISSFARFEVRDKKARIGRNPKTKVEAKISDRKVVSFRASTLLKNDINSDYQRIIK